MQTNDELWKGAFEDLAVDFIQKFYPDIYPYLDPNRPIEFLDKELAQLCPDSEDGKRAVDKLLKVYLTGVFDPQIIYIHSEIQGYFDEIFDERNFIYFYRLFDRFKGNIAVLVIYTDDNGDYKPSVFEYRFMGTTLIYRFPICKVLDLDPQILAASDNLFDAVLLTTYWAIQRKKNALTEEDLINLKIDLMRRLLLKNVDKEKIRRLFDFIKGYLRLEKPKNKLIFDEKYDNLINFEKNMGITEILVRQARDEARAIALAEAKVEAEALTKAKIEAEEKLAEEAIKQRKNTVLNMRKFGFLAEKIADIVDYPLVEVLSYFKEEDDEKLKLTQLD